MKSNTQCLIKANVNRYTNRDNNTHCDYIHWISLIGLNPQGYSYVQIQAVPGFVQSMFELCTDFYLYQVEYNIDVIEECIDHSKFNILSACFDEDKEELLGRGYIDMSYYLHGTNSDTLFVSPNASWAYELMY